MFNIKQYVFEKIDVCMMIQTLCNVYIIKALHSAP